MKNARQFAKLGITRRTDLDFTDDGARFSGYEYKGMPITYTKGCGKMYFAIRPDYLKDLAYCDYSGKDWYPLCDKFNGVEEIFPTELIETLEVIVESYNALKNKIAAQTIDFTEFNARRETEAEIIKNLINRAKTEFNFLEAPDWAMSRMRSYVGSLNRRLAELPKIKCENTPQARSYLHRLEKDGYILVNENDFYAKQIDELLEKFHF